jgi:hypothetical protein
MLQHNNTINIEQSINDTQLHNIMNLYILLRYYTKKLIPNKNTLYINKQID